MALKKKDKILIGSGLGLIGLIALLSGSKSSKGSEGNPVGTEGCLGGLIPFDGICVNPNKKGNENEPVGPAGCAPGLVNKNGICVKPVNPNPNKDQNKNNGLGSAGELYVSQDCKVIKYGDKTGNVWWAEKGKSTAKLWIEKGYNNSLLISYGMLEGLTKCLAEFPIQPDFGSRRQLEGARILWIKANRPLWNLLYGLRNKINKEYFAGNKTIEMDSTGKIILGKSFNIGSFWESYKPMAAVLLQMSLNEDKNFKAFDETIWNGLVPADTFGAYQPVQALAAWILFTNYSNLTVAEFLKLYNNTTLFTEKNEIFNYIFKAIYGMWQDDSYMVSFPLEQEIIP